MATRTVVTYVCDLCEAEGDDVATHEVAVDGQARTFEACGLCWQQVAALWGKVEAAGRTPEPRRRRRGAQS